MSCIPNNQPQQTHVSSQAMQSGFFLKLYTICTECFTRRPRLARWLYRAAVLITPLVMFALICALATIHPFGINSFLTEDLKYQYIDFFTWFRSVLLGEHSLAYSFAQGLGFNTWGLYSYYLASPFNLLVVLFDQAHLSLAIFVIVACKLSAITASFVFYLRKRFLLDRSISLLFALCFCFGSWMVTNLRNPLWLDAQILLPLMA